LQLTSADFDSRGDIDFIKSNVAEEQVRGFFPYYQPSGWVRYGLNVKRYHTTAAGTEDDSWLKMNGNPSEWAVMYHGVRCPTSNVSGSSTVAKAIINNSLWTGGSGQAYAGAKPVLTSAHSKAFTHYGKNTDAVVGRGAYGSPLITGW
jgi:hypothetical protein